MKRSQPLSILALVVAVALPVAADEPPAPRTYGELRGSRTTTVLATLSCRAWRLGSQSASKKPRPRVEKLAA